ncbi:MAG: glycosyltransferase [Planctomycetaceae bacterium]|nr:MAG: glycosyltransferase [Planctomycetaceae bacterium]
MIPEIIFWACIGLILLPYIGYPLILAILSIFWPRRPIPETTDWPSISVLISAFNAQDEICGKIHNVLDSDYPADKLEVIVCSDGSTDGTNRLVEQYGDERVLLAASPKNIGKNATMALGAAIAKGQLLLLVDYNEMLDKGAIRAAARHFADPKVGIVTGRIEHLNPMKTSVGSGYRAYWMIEDGVRLLESRLGLGVVVLGSFEMIRREAYLPVPSEFSNDMGAPLYAHSKGYLCRYEPAAWQSAVQRKNPQQEFARRLRMVVRAWSSIPYLLSIVPFWKNVGNWLALLCHKYMRWLTWVFMIGLLVTNAILADCGDFWTHGWDTFSSNASFYRVFMAVQLAAYAMALAGWLLARAGIRVKLLSMPFFFCLLQTAACKGFFQSLAGKKIGTWKIED